MSKKKCPFRTTTTHIPERKSGYKIYCAQEIVEFGECYEGKCPYFDNGKCTQTKPEALKERSKQ